MSLMKNPLISVIVPVYNVAEYLDKCLSSIINQSYKNLEIICVNDGSTDNSFHILEKYAKMDSRIKIISQENSGVAKARNVGLNCALGDYISFVDSDDYIEDCLYEKCLINLRANDDVIIFGANTVNLKSNKIYKGQYSSKFFNSVFQMSGLFSFHTVPWNKLYRKQFLMDNNINFDNIKIAEDQSFFVKVVLSAKNISIMKEDLYNYVKYRNGALSSVKDGNDLSIIYATYNIISFLKQSKIDKEVTNKIITHYLLKVLSWSSKINNNIECVESMIDELFDIIRQNFARNWWDYYNVKLYPSKISFKNILQKYPSKISFKNISILKLQYAIKFVKA